MTLTARREHQAAIRSQVPEDLARPNVQSIPTLKRPVLQRNKERIEGNQMLLTVLDLSRSPGSHFFFYLVLSWQKLCRGCCKWKPRLRRGETGNLSRNVELRCWRVAGCKWNRNKERLSSVRCRRACGRGWRQIVWNSRQERKKSEFEFFKVRKRNDRDYISMCRLRRQRRIMTGKEASQKETPSARWEKAMTAQKKQMQSGNNCFLRFFQVHWKKMRSCCGQKIAFSTSGLSRG